MVGLALANLAQFSPQPHPRYYCGIMSNEDDNIVDNIISSEEEEDVDDDEADAASAQPTNGTAKPELEVIDISTDEEEEEAEVDPDPDLTKAIRESLKQNATDTKDTPKSAAPKRNGEGTPSAEDPKRPKLSCESGNVDEAFAGFLEEMRSKIASADEFERVRKRLERKKAKVKAEHLEGVALRELIDEQKEAMRLDVRGEETFEFVVVVLDAFRRLSGPQEEDGDQLEDAPLIHSKHGPKIRELEAKLKEYQKQVKRLLEAETDLDDEDESAFVKVGKCKARILQIYSRLAKLQDFDDQTRRYRTVRFRGSSRYPEIDAKVTEFVNGRLSMGKEPQPNYRTVKELVEITNKEKNLALTDAALEFQAQETFEAVVKKLRARRMRRTLDRLEEDYLPEDPSGRGRADPAASDPELARKLAEGYRDPGEQERRVLEEFRLKSAELGEKEENEEEEKELSEVESEISAKTGERSDDDDFDLDAIIMMTSDEEDEEEVKNSDVAEQKEASPESEGSEIL